MGDEILNENNGLEELALRALRFQNYILRRAWGIYYAVWVLAFALWSAVPFVIQTIYPNAPSTLYFIVYSLIGFMAGAATAKIFSDARRTLVLRKIISRNIRGRGRSFVYRFWWSLFYVVMVLAFIFLRFYFYTILLVLLTLVDFFVYFELRTSFSKIPPEGFLAVISYAISIPLSLYLAIASSVQILYFLPWTFLMFSWMFCSLYALYHAPEYMVE